MMYREPMTSAEKTARDRNLAKLPELSHVTLATEDVICLIKKGESGYYRTDWPKGKDGDAFAAERNARMGVTPAQASAMVNGSMFGWHLPAADPDHDVNNPKRTPKNVRIAILRAEGGR